MARSSSEYEGVPVHPDAFAASGHDHVEVLGQPRASRSPAVHTQAPADRPSGRVTTANVLQLLEYQRYRCALTGRELEPTTASLDHIVPVRSGGEHAIENTQVLHKDVNRAKSTMTNEQFIQLCCEVVERVCIGPDNETADQGVNA